MMPEAKVINHDVLAHEWLYDLTLTSFYCIISFFVKTLSRQQHFTILRFFLTSSLRQAFAHA